MKSLLHVSFQAVELFDMMSRWESMAANLPIIQQRLLALNELHQQGEPSRGQSEFMYSLLTLAFQFSSSLSHYESEQQALKSSLDANDHLLKQVGLAISFGLTLLVHFCS